MSTEKLIALWQHALAGAPPRELTIFHRESGSFLAISPEGAAAVIVPLSPGVRQRGRVLGGIRLRYEERLRFDVDGRRWTQPAAVIDCLDRGILRTFCVVVRDVLAQLEPRRVTATQVAEALRSWDDRICRTTELSAASELDLWGELFVMSRAPTSDAMASAWRAECSDRREFAAGGVVLACKTSTRRLRHSLRLGRVAADEEAVASHFASVWAVEDCAGKTLPELVDEVMSTVDDEDALLRKLLNAGYREADREQHGRRFRCPAAPTFFRVEHLPRLGEADDGITDVCYEVDLAGVPRLDRRDADELVRRLSVAAA